MHTVDRDAQFNETLPAIEISSETAKWWYDAWPKAPYTGDTGGSEKSVPGDVTTGDQKKLYEKFYRDAVSDPVEGVKPHRKLVTSHKPEDETRDALDRFFSPAGKMSDLESAMNCDPKLIWSRPEAAAFRKYCRAGGLAWTSEEGEVIRDSNGEKCFSVVGYCERLPGKDADKHYTQVTRKVKKAVKRVIQGGVSDAARESLLESLTYVLPPGDEASMIKSPRGQSKKQRIARPSQNLRCLLKHIARSYQENYPPTEWSLDSRPLGEVLDHHLTIADDKAIGWTAFLYPGTRANLQKDPEKRRNVINLAKFRMALRFSWASSLHAMSPKDMVDQGLRDPAIAFVKGEGHPPRKVESETWRLIWNLSEVDRLLDAAVFTDQDKADIQSFQSAPRTENGRLVAALGSPMELAVGVGHDDANLERTYHELECLLAKSPDNCVRSSDASGWDFSVSASSFWCSMEARLCRAQSTAHFRSLLVGGFFQSAWIVSTGCTLWQSERFGITASGSSVTTSKNSQERSGGSKLGQVVKKAGGLKVVNEMTADQIVSISQDKEVGTTSTGDDNLHSHDQDYDSVREFGTILRDSTTVDASTSNPVPYLSHHYSRDENGQWSCRYANGGKLAEG